MSVPLLNRRGNGVAVGDAVGVGVIVGVAVAVGVGVATRSEIAPHPTIPGKSNKESNKMPALKNMFFRFILASLLGSLCRPTGGASAAAPKALSAACAGWAGKDHLSTKGR